MSTGAKVTVEVLRICNSIGAENIDFCRSAAVDSSGRELNRNRLIALMSAIVLEEVRISGAAILFPITLFLVSDEFIDLLLASRNHCCD